MWVIWTWCLAAAMAGTTGVMLSVDGPVPAASQDKVAKAIAQPEMAWRPPSELGGADGIARSLLRYPGECFAVLDEAQVEALAQLRESVDSHLYVAVASAEGPKATRLWRWDASRRALMLVGRTKGLARASHQVPEGRVAWLGDEPPDPAALRGVRALGMDPDEQLARALVDTLLDHPNECVADLSATQQDHLAAKAESTQGALYVATRLRGPGVLLWRWHEEDRTLRMVRP